jgi:DMSO/TMAO reductase YedYZ heme-binding membrane subunit
MNTINQHQKIEFKDRLSTLWILVLMNMIYADIYSIIVELVNKNTLDINGDVKVVMAIAAIVTNIPIFMIYLSRVLPYKWNRWGNIIAGVLTIIYIIGGGSSTPHYIIVATVEIILLLIIIVTSWKWTNRK